MQGAESDLHMQSVCAEEEDKMWRLEDDKQGRKGTKNVKNIFLLITVIRHLDYPLAVLHWDNNEIVKHGSPNTCHDPQFLIGTSIHSNPWKIFVLCKFRFHFFQVHPEKGQSIL